MWACATQADRDIAQLAQYIPAVAEVFVGFFEIFEHMLHVDEQAHPSVKQAQTTQISRQRMMKTTQMPLKCADRWQHRPTSAGAS